MEKRVVYAMRARKRQQTRKPVAKVAMNLFLKRGFDHVTVNQIADAADVSDTPELRARDQIKYAGLEQTLAEALAERVGDKREPLSRPVTCGHRGRGLATER